MDTAVARAFGLLEALAREGGPVRMSRLAADVGLQKSTAHRLLQTLIALGYVDQEAETGRYGPSLKLWELGSAVVAEHPIRRAAAGFLQALHKETGETVSLLVRSGDDVLYLDKLISPRPVRFSTRPGSRAPAPLTAGGRAMLAHDPDADAVAQRLAGKGDFDPDVFARELADARARGYALVRKPVGVVSMGGALMGRDGRAVAALSVSAPAERLDADAEARLAEALLSACARVAESVGHL